MISDQLVGSVFKCHQKRERIESIMTNVTATQD